MTIPAVCSLHCRQLFSKEIVPQSQFQQKGTEIKGYFLKCINMEFLNSVKLMEFIPGLTNSAFSVLGM